MSKSFNNDYVSDFINMELPGCHQLKPKNEGIIHSQSVAAADMFGFIIEQFELHVAINGLLFLCNNFLSKLFTNRRSMNFRLFFSCPQLYVPINLHLFLQTFL